MNNKAADRIACITLDLEQDYGRTDAYICSTRVAELCQVLLRHEVKLTAFVVGKILDERHQVIETLAQIGTEFALHSYSHNLAKTPDTGIEIKRAKVAYEDYFGQAPQGYRSPQCRTAKTHFQILEEKGFLFDSSIIPAWRPGVYSNLTAPLHPYHIGNILEIPFSVIPQIRLPLVMSYMKLLGVGYDVLIKAFGLPHIVVFGFHMHDLFKTESLDKLPMKYRVIHNRNASQALVIFDSFLSLLRGKGYIFTTMGQLAERFRETYG